MLNGRIFCLVAGLNHACLTLLQPYDKGVHVGLSVVLILAVHIFRGPLVTECSTGVKTYGINPAFLFLRKLAGASYVLENESARLS
jgi:hypothetical protein